MNLFNTVVALSSLSSLAAAQTAGTFAWRVTKRASFEDGLLASDDDRVYAGSTTNGVFGISKADGSTDFNTAVDDDAALMGAGAIVFNKLFAAATDGTAYMFELSDGENFGTILSQQSTSSEFADGLLTSDFESNIFVGSMEGEVYAFQTSSLGVDWTVDVDSAVKGDAALSDDTSTLYIATNDGSVYALSTSDGSQQWRTTNSATFKDGLLASDADRVYVGSMQGVVYGFNKDDGSRAWSTVVDSAIKGSGAISDDGSKLYVASNAGTFYALSVETGAIASTTTTTNTTFLDGLLYCDCSNYAYAGSSTGVVYSFDLNDQGSVFFQTASLGDALEGGGEISSDGTLLYVASGGGVVAAVNTGTGGASASNAETSTLSIALWVAVVLQQLVRW